MQTMVRRNSKLSQLDRIRSCFLDPRAVDENTSLKYQDDDIRLCTIKRSTANLPVGISLHYHRHERFHYLKLVDDDSSALTKRAGLKSFDRIIEYNNINVEDYSIEELKRKIEDKINLHFQVLVCSPATYKHYKRNHKKIHYQMSTVRRRRSVHDRDAMYLDADNRYRIVAEENTTVAITLVNTSTTIDSDSCDTIQGIDRLVFTTAKESVDNDDIRPRLANLLSQPNQVNIFR